MLSVRSSPSSSVFENPNPNLRKRYLDGSHKGFERSLIDAYGRDPRVRVSEFELQSERNRNLGSRYPQQPSWNQPSKPPSHSSQNLHNAKGMCNNFQTPFVATSLPPPVHPSLSQSLMPVPSVGSRPPVNQGPSISRVGFQSVVPATPVGLRPPVNAENSHTRPERSSFTLPNQRNSSTVKNQGPLHSLQNSGSVVSSNQTGISPYSGLLSSLLAQGVISLPNKTPHHDSLGVESKADPHQHGPLGVEFKPELLSVRNESVLSALYKNGPTPSSAGTLSVQNSGPSLPKNQPDISAYSGLLSSLVAQGVISLPKQESLGVVFKPELLKVRHESVIHSLYSDMPRQCTTCGHRFKCQEEHRKHMDWHVVKNRMSKTQTKKKQMRSRMWFVDTSLWLGASSADAAGPKFKTEAIVEKKKIDEETAVPADEDRTSCALCGEAFDDFYSQVTEDWMYKDAAYLNAPDLRSPEGRDRSELGPIVHKACISDGSLRKRLRRSKHSGFR